MSECGSCDGGYRDDGSFCRNRSCEEGQKRWTEWNARKASKDAMPKCALCDEDGFVKGHAGQPCSCARGVRAGERMAFRDGKREADARARRPTCFLCSICGVLTEEPGDLYCVPCAIGKYGSLECAADVTVMRARRFFAGVGHRNILHPEDPHAPERPFHPDPDIAGAFLARVERLFPGTAKVLAKKWSAVRPLASLAAVPSGSVAVADAPASASVGELRARYVRVRALMERARPHRFAMLQKELTRIAAEGRKARKA